PHFRRDDLAHGPGAFAGGAQAGDDGIGVVAVEGEKLNDVQAGGFAEASGEVLVVAGGIDQRLPLVSVAVGRVEHEVEVDVDEARDVFGVLEVAADPV